MPHRPWPILAAIAICLLLLACSSAPPTSQNDASFTDARNNFKASDFKAAWRNLNNVGKGSSDESQRQHAIVLRTALVTALADANKQMAEAYYIGAKPPRGSRIPAPITKCARTTTTPRAFLADGMQAVMDRRSKLGATPLVIELTFPGFQGTNAAINKIKSGQPVSDNDHLSAERQAIRDVLATVLSAIAGAPDDLNKGQQIYSNKVEIDPRAYLIDLSNNFYQSEVMFDWRGLNQPDKTRLVNDVVRGNLDIAQKMLTAKPGKDMQARVKKMR